MGWESEQSKLRDREEGVEGELASCDGRQSVGEAVLVASARHFCNFREGSLDRSERGSGEQ